MLQFEVLTIAGVRRLCIADATRHDAFIGLRRIVKELYD